MVLDWSYSSWWKTLYCTCEIYSCKHFYYYINKLVL